MKIRLANVNDESVWDDFVEKHPQATPYHRFAWKKSVENAYRHKSLYLIAEDESRHVVGVLPAIVMRPAFFSGKLSSLPFCDLAGALAVDQTIQAALITAAQNMAAETGLKYFEYRTSSLADESAAMINRTLPADQKVRMILDLPDSSETLLSGFKSKLRSQIKKAEKNGLTVEIGQTDQLIDDFYDVFSCNMRDLGSPTHSKQWFHEIKRHYKQNMIISIIKVEGEAIGAGIVLFNGVNASIPWASTKRNFNHLSPNMLLYWSLLQYTTDNGYKAFDFGRSTPGEGTFKFKQQWGAKPVPLLWENKVIGSNKQEENFSHSQGRLREIIESVWRLLPLALTIYIGPRVRKYISL